MRTQNRKRGTMRPALWVAAYNAVLLLLFIFGAITQVSWEGFGFIPLFALTLPWSWLLTWLLSHTQIDNLAAWGSGLSATLLINFVLFNLASAAVNSYLFYILLKWVRKRADEIEQWEQARWHRYEP